MTSTINACVGVGVGVGVWVGVAVGVAVGVEVAVGAAVGVCVCVAVGVDVGIAVAVGSAIAVCAAVGSASGAAVGAEATDFADPASRTPLQPTARTAPNSRRNDRSAQRRGRRRKEPDLGAGLVVIAPFPIENRFTL
jgi:hypothetical protein